MIKACNKSVEVTVPNNCLDIKTKKGTMCLAVSSKVDHIWVNVDGQGTQIKVDEVMEVLETLVKKKLKKKGHTC